MTSNTWLCLVIFFSLGISFNIKKCVFIFNSVLLHSFLLNLVSKEIMQTCSIQNAVLKNYFIQFFYNKYFLDCHSEPLGFFLMIKIWLFLHFGGLLQLYYYYEELSWLFSVCQVNNAKKLLLCFHCQMYLNFCCSWLLHLLNELLINQRIIS